MLSEVFGIERMDHDVSIFEILWRRLYLNWQIFCEQFSVDVKMRAQSSDPRLERIGNSLLCLFVEEPNAAKRDSGSMGRAS